MGVKIPEHLRENRDREVGSRVPLLLCECFLTFLVALDYRLCGTLEEKKVLEGKQGASLLSISHVEPYLSCYSNYRCFTLLFVCMGVQLSQSVLTVHSNEQESPQKSFILQAIFNY